jgi:8-amino-7-oxononanoate synthase
MGLNLDDFREEMASRLGSLRAQNLFRELRVVEPLQAPYVQINGRKCLNCSSNDYLGLASHPAVREAAIKAIERFGAGAGASRLICGTLPPHRELEEALASFKATEAALSFSSGYAAAVGTICALVGPPDVIILDKLVHASVVDAARLSGAKLRVFDHNDMADLEKILQWAAVRPVPAGTVGSGGGQRQRRTLIVTESVFSMDGDLAPLPEIVRLKEQYEAWLMVDEAHATGLYGGGGAGLVSASGLGGRVEIQMGTLSKAAGTSGGYICGIQPLVDLLINRARSFIFSTAPMPSAAAAATAGLGLIRGAEGDQRRKKLWTLVESFSSELGLETSPGAIIPIMVGDEARASAWASELRERGILIPAVRYPTVARGQARLRATVTAAHSAEELSRVARLLRSMIPHQTP